MGIQLILDVNKFLHDSELLLAGWARGNDNESASRTQKRPRDVIDVSWATGKFFFVTHLIFILLTKLFKYNFKLLTTMTMAPAPRRVDCGDDETTGRRNTEK